MHMKENDFYRQYAAEKSKNKTEQKKTRPNQTNKQQQQQINN